MSVSVSKGLSYGEKELEVADVLDDALIRRAGGRGAGIDAGGVQLLGGSLEAVEIRRIDTVPQVHTERPDRGAVANPKADSMHHVVEILEVMLIGAEGQVFEAGVDIAHVVVEDTADVVADQRKAELGLVEQESAAAQGEASAGVAGTGLKFGKAAVGVAAAAEEAFGQGNGQGGIAVVVEGVDFAELSAAREHQALADGIVGGIADQQAREIDLRTEGMIGDAEIDRGVEALVGIDRIVAAVLHQVDGGDAHADGLGELGDEERCDLEVPDGDPAVGEAVEERGGLADLLGKLGGGLRALEVKGSDVARIFE